MDKVFICGKILPREKAAISPFDRGFSYGDGVFETIGVFSGVPFLLEKHLQRLFLGLQLLEIKLPYSKEQLIAKIREYLKENNVVNGVLKIIVSRGVGERGLLPAKDLEPTVLMSLSSLPSREFKPIKTSFLSVPVLPPKLVIGQIKTLNQLPQVLAAKECQKKGIMEGIRLTLEGYLAEGSMANLFWVKNGVLKTPEKNLVLPGIARELILELARVAGIPVSEGKYPAEEILGATEIFFTNSVRGIIPVGQLDQREFHDYSVTNRLWTLYESYLEKYILENRREG
ncbi:aminotransferase class IV [Carboxydothermus ferrireducens]|uniref:Aminodeoxychorismate lyase n=1 Tax=Carboxydothermus ferrireducens DSM 11255 TaxID=1119529 RepID=A0ABX2R8X9_9THEO|nr:aminotransferase class IV [Carboxydothermus ferrireducens]NYE57634.1 aminodeoxychorismate lyase [Carboxydothermus ferrireducens DSM 11255]